MNRVFVDTNLFLRYLTNDIPEQASLFESLLERAATGHVRLIVNTMVIAEIVWTLESYYRFPKEQIDDVVSSIVASGAFEIPERDILLQSLEDFHTLNIDFIDAYIGNWMKANGIRGIYTLNRKDFQRIPEVDVLDPAGLSK